MYILNFDLSRGLRYVPSLQKEKVREMLQACFLHVFIISSHKFVKEILACLCVPI